MAAVQTEHRQGWWEGAPARQAYGSSAKPSPSSSSVWSRMNWSGGHSNLSSPSGVFRVTVKVSLSAEGAAAAGAGAAAAGAGAAAAGAGAGAALGGAVAGALGAAGATAGGAVVPVMVGAIAAVFVGTVHALEELSHDAPTLSFSCACKVHGAQVSHQVAARALQCKQPHVEGSDTR
eukprot:6184759-Pleurochrysis_carterae.AAC.3